MRDLREKPFYLDDEGINWVVNTLGKMSTDDKIGQLFCLVSYSNDEEYLNFVAKDLKVGGLMCRIMPKKEVLDTVRILQKSSDIPMFISANFEAGGDGISSDGTHLGCEMAVAATDDIEMAYKLGVVCGREGSALGANWTYAPVIDMDYNFRNPITNTRTFGSDAERVAKMGCAYIKGVQENGMAATIKHFPGDGVDERDQHLVTSINTLTCEEWDNTYGMVYKKCIEAGALTVMVGHIAQPAYSKKISPSLSDEDILPASLSYELTTQLLKHQLGFKGLVATDATAMAGMAIPMERSAAVPMAIAAGCDVFMFTRNLQEDFKYMKRGIESGVLTDERLNEAVTKILALKAALKLHRKKAENRLASTEDIANRIVGCEEHIKWAEECADRSITLVKEEKGVLPISSSKTKRVLLYDIECGGNAFGFGVKEGVAEKIIKRLQGEGFSVEKFMPPKGFEGMMTSYEEFVSKYDLLIYIANLATKSNQTIVRIEWASPMGANVPIYINKIPTIFISLENPYHLLDVPRVKTYINTYGSTDIIIEALMNKLTGRSEFKGISPVDAFCGKWDTRL